MTLSLAALIPVSSVRPLMSTFSVRVAAIVPPPDRPTPAVMVTPECAMCSSATKFVSASWSMPDSTTFSTAPAVISKCVPISSHVAVSRDSSQNSMRSSPGSANAIRSGSTPAPPPPPDTPSAWLTRRGVMSVVLFVPAMACASVAISSESYLLAIAVDISDSSGSISAPRISLFTSSAGSESLAVKNVFWL